MKRASIIVLNHALLLSEYLEESESSLLPKLEYLVLDEVHNLEAVATDALKVTSDSVLFEKCVIDLTRAIKKYNKTHPLDTFLSPEVTAISDSLLMTARILFDEIESAFSLSLMTPAKGAYGGGRAQEALLETPVLEAAKSRVYEMLDLVSAKVHDLERVLFAAPEPLTKDTTRIFEHLTGLTSHIRTFFSPTAETPLIQIYSAREGVPPRIISTPLRVGEIMQARLWSRIPSVVMMSATLTTGGTFDYISRVLELADFEKVIFETDFDYSKQALLYIPPELPDVAKSEHTRAIQDFLADLLAIYGGRTLMLFTSFATIKETMLALAARMKSIGITLLAQGLGGGKHKLAQEFVKKSNTSVLLGTDSFWEGVDFAGDLLELLVIYKLPFAVPTDPVFVARSRLYSDSFREYAIPMMILKFRQGLGRLIRTRTDK